MKVKFSNKTSNIMPKDGKDKSKDKSVAKPVASQGDGDSDIEEEQIKVS